MINKENIIGLIHSIIKKSTNKDTQQIYGNYCKESVSVEIIDRNDYIMAKLNNGVKQHILVINEEYKIALISDSMDREYVNPNSIIIFNSNYEYMYNMFIEIIEGNDAPINLGDYYLVYKSKHLSKLSNVIITFEAQNMFINNMRAIEKFINSYTFMLMVKSRVDVIFKLINIGRINNVITLQNKNDIKNIKNALRANNCKLYKIRDTNNEYVIDISGHNLMDIYDILYIEQDHSIDPSFINNTKARLMIDKNIFNDFILDTLYSCGYTDEDLESNDEIEIYLNNKNRNILSFNGNKFEFYKNNLSQFKVRLNDIKKFKKYEFTSFDTHKIKLQKNGFINTVRLKEDDSENGKQCEYFMLVDNGENWESLMKQSNVLYISNDDLDVDKSKFMITDSGAGYKSFILRNSKDNQMLDTIISKIELYFD